MEREITEINIDKYVQGELTGDALIKFETLLEKDEALQEKVKFSNYADAVLHKNLASENLEDSGIDDLKPILDKLGDKYFSENEYAKTNEAAATVIKEKEQPNRIRRLLPFATLAAAAALLLLLFLPKAENELFAKHFEVPENQGKMGILDKANTAYKAQNYKQAISLYNEHLLKEPNSPNVLLYKGGAALALKQTDTAIKTFEQLVKNQRYADAANWYLALAYLKKGEEEKTKSYLKLISVEDKVYYDKAQLLLKESSLVSY